ncbi:hypothetical protein BC939DRAFT_469634 [Gamsiella multidivaricata]|uniref:uncharacterized protein n=1 Tax=Gamsiella multidivaricata TaxID=101098 RepID=UPI002220D603|nr:uncharacterized protein BC939DRAFT_469634 [Gamsiella multidivaricata]KAG0361702.1 hypothetical protein BGZ54_009003 [Gamsiella multidivaricata]KAI7816298.1 hypothetical protein BC939DRAFT_469634 [Gamsiella multidivaricata]
MISADEILSIITAVFYLGLLIHFAIRFARSRWWIYFFIGLFCAIRIVAYVIRAYVESDAVTYGSSKWISLYITETTLLSIGVIFILLILARLYASILPKLRHVAGHSRGKFEATLVLRTRLFLLPIIACVIAGAVLASPDYTESQQNTGLILRKVAVLGLMAVALIFLYAAWNYRQRYPENKRAFELCLVVTGLFVVSLIYKIVYTFRTSALTTTWAYFVFSPLLELAALVVLSVDLQMYFLGRKEDKLPKEELHDLA